MAVSAAILPQALNVCIAVACHYETLQKSSIAVKRGFLAHFQIPLYLR